METKCYALMDGKVFLIEVFLIEAGLQKVATAATAGRGKQAPPKGKQWIKAKKNYTCFSIIVKVYGGKC